ncbi:hypothetical protein [Quadrisphaera sp. KR29]|uniref:hypothetical protein n=1 Tax=Quadrisphaera sp. KR29 TaxID=3461391 RepID=UPI004043BAF8
MRGGFLGVAVATAAAAVFTLLLNSSVARGEDPAVAADFQLFWYGALIVSFGVFLPLEQVVSRAAARGPLRGAAVVRPALVLLGIAVAGVLAASPLLGDDAATRAWVVTALLALAGVSALQYAARGLALGRGRLGPYAGALAADAGLRALAALAAAVLVVRPPGVLFASFVVGSALVAHVGLLLAVRRGRPAVAAGAPPHELHDVGELGVGHEHPRTGSTAVVAPPRTMTRAVLTLLGANVAGQLLLNAGPLLVGLEPGPDDVVAAYGLAFTLARAPLFVVVPAQAVLVPPMVRMVAEGRHHELRVRMAQASAAVVVLAVVGAAGGALVSGPAMAVFTESTYAVSPLFMALLVGGCLVHAGLVVGTQALVATGAERAVLVCWVTGLLVAAAWIAAAQLLLGASAPWAVAGGFTAGSAAGWVLSVLVLVRRPRSTA